MLVSIDIIVLLVYTIVEVARGNLTAALESNEEHFISLSGVSDLSIKHSSKWCIGGNTSTKPSSDNASQKVHYESHAA